MDGVKESPNSLVVVGNPSFEFGQFHRQVPVGPNHLAQFHEVPHNGYIDFNRLLAAKNTEKHRHTLFGEAIGRILGIPAVAF